MCLELPSDVWLVILENYIPRREDLSNIASTNKHIRELALPTLYHQLTFGGATTNGNARIVDHLTVITSSRERAEALQHFPHLLRHVRICRLHRWRRLPRLLDMMRHDRGAESSTDSEDTTLLWSSAYEAVTALLLRLPGIKSLVLQDCPVTPRLQSSFYGNPLLESLVLQRCREDPETPIPHGGQAINRIQALEYDPDISHTDSNFLPLLSGCLFSLKSLAIPFRHVPEVLKMAGDHRLPLRTLALRSRKGEKEPDSSTTCRLLMSCPQIHTLSVSKPRMDWSSLPEDALPELQVVAGDGSTLRALVPGRPVHSVRILDYTVSTLKRGNFDLLGKSTVPIRNVTADLDAFTVDATMALRSGFESLTHLSLRYMSFPSSADSALKHITDKVVSTLSQWPQLRVCRAIDMYSERRVYQTPTKCPIAGDDPRNRGHPSLEELCLFNPFTWIWFPGEGWTCKRFDVYEMEI